MEEKKMKPAYVVFKKLPKGNLYITWSFTTQVNKNKGGIWDCSIPEFEIYFNADSKEELDAKSLAFTKMFGSVSF